MNYKTAHQLAAQLLALPDLPVFTVDGGSGVFSEVGTPHLAWPDKDDEIPEDFGINHTGPFVSLYTGK